MDSDAAPLRDFSDRPEHSIPTTSARSTLVEDISMLWECNWKVGVDAFNEVYTCKGSPRAAVVHRRRRLPDDILGNHSRFLFRVGYPAPDDELARREGYRDRNQVTAMMRVIMEGAGLDAGRSTAARRGPPACSRRGASTAGATGSRTTVDRRAAPRRLPYFIPNIT